MSDPGVGFFDVPSGGDTNDSIQRRIAYARMLQQQAQRPPEGAYGGLASAANSILGALQMRSADKAQAANYAKMLQSTIGTPQTTTTVAAPTIGAPTVTPGPNGTLNSTPNITPASAPNQSTQYSGALGKMVGNDKAALYASLLQGLGPEQGTKFLQNAALTAAENEDRKVHTLTPDEILAQHLRPGGTYQQDAFGKINTAQAPDTMSDAALQQAIGLHQKEQELSPTALAQKKEIERFSQAPQWAQLAESSRHNKVEEGIAQNPFGLNVPGASNKTGDDLLSALPPGLAAQIKAVGTYRQPAPAGRTSPTGIKFMTLVNQAYPSYDASQYGTKVKARNDFATGKNGNTVRSLNVAVQHLDQLGQLSDALGNGNLQLANQIGQAYAQQTGSAAPTNFDAAKQIAGDEIVKAIVGTGGAQSDRDEAAKQISRASSPTQLKGVIQTYQGLLGGQLKGLRQQYQKTTGLDDFEDFLAPETQAKLEHTQAQPAPSGGKKTIKFGDLP